jgi:hypothetical protein
MKQLYNYSTPASERAGFQLGQSTFLDFVGRAVSYDNSTFQAFLLPHIIEYACLTKNLWDVSAINANDIIDGIRLARTNGAFRREFSVNMGDEHDATRRVVCPFGFHAVKWLGQDLGHRNNPKDAALVRCYQKVLAEKDSNPHIRAMCDSIRRGMAAVINEYNAAPPAAAIAVSASPARPRQETPPAQCPFHRTQG